MTYLLLFVSITLEVFGSTMLKVSNGFTRLLPVLGVAVGYGLSFYLVSLVLRALPLGVVYATWSGLGTILTVAAGVVFFKERINGKGLLGIALLIVGLVLINLSE